MEKRVEFSKGKQRAFLENCKKQGKLDWKRLAQKTNVNPSTLARSYRYEYCRIPHELLKKLCKLNSINEQEVIKKYNFKIIDYDPASIIGRKVFGERRVKLPENNIKFEKTEYRLDSSDIILNDKDKLKGLKFPTKITPELAEEIGMHLGDGFLSNNQRYEYRLKGNKDEQRYYDEFVRKLYKKVYGIDINLKEYETTYGFEFSSKSFWRFKKDILKIPVGRKENIFIPDAIKVTNKEILTAFVRGLFDTDGCITFAKKYKQFGNYYPSIILTLKSERLIRDTAEILQMLGLEPKVASSGGYWTISLNGYKRLEVYSKLIGWSNSKHIDKVINWKKQYPKLSMAVVV